MTQCACNEHMLYNKRCNPHLRVVAVISTIERIDKNAHIIFHFVQNSQISLELHKT